MVKHTVRSCIASATNFLRMDDGDLVDAAQLRFLSLARQAAEAESPFPFFHLFGICNINYTTNLVDFLLIPRAFVCFLSFLLQRLGTPSIPMQNIIRAMHPGEVASVGYLSPSNSPSLRVHYNMPQLNITSSNCSSLNGPFFTPHYQAMPVMGGLILPSSCFGSCAASNEAGDDQLMLAAERRKRRMLSNRESARRSRIRKQKHLGELYSQVIRLRSANRLLLDELNRVVSEQDQIIYENNRLQNEESELQKKLASLPGDCNCEPQVAKLQG